MYTYYYLYKITNLLNGRIYIGVHRTNNLDDNYMGSGIILKHAQDKYGLKNFKKEILEFFDNENDMFQKEIEIVNTGFILREDTYNISTGGRGADFNILSKAGKIGGKICGKYLYENSMGMFSEYSVEKRNRYLVSKENLNRLIKMSKKANSLDTINRKKETFAKIKHQQGSKNSQYNTMWITNDIINKKINKEEQIPFGWKKGRIQKKKKTNN